MKQKEQEHDALGTTGRYLLRQALTLGLLTSRIESSRG